MAGNDLVAGHVVALEPGVVRAGVDDLHIGEADAVGVGAKENVLRSHGGNVDLLEVKALEALAGQLPDQRLVGNLVFVALVAGDLAAGIVSFCRHVQPVSKKMGVVTANEPLSPSGPENSRWGPGEDAG